MRCDYRRQLSAPSKDRSARGHSRAIIIMLVLWHGERAAPPSNYRTEHTSVRISGSRRVMLRWSVSDAWCYAVLHESAPDNLGWTDARDGVAVAKRNPRPHFVPFLLYWNAAAYGLELEKMDNSRTGRHKFVREYKNQQMSDKLGKYLHLYEVDASINTFIWKCQSWKVL